ncbi:MULTISPECIES: transcriptional regulator GcvA [unclassified Afipia]|uniref:transcriptional regulator GcvA n=1 Tax=unclassified Afipia TaxID=2642050 RepID=UPI0004644E40|nr:MULTISPECIES: transcriptional regulator GcvA [unclassified Afipia]MBS4006678.1 transcriptional regulator GcvA [Afipia sp.]
MRHRLPPLNSLRLFEASARLLSFKNAAEELLLTPSAVSHGIQSLEDWLGTPLFLRTTKGIVLSEAGTAYIPVVRQALELLANGSANIANQQGLGQLAISMAPTFAAKWLLPRLHRFRERHPDIRIVIDTSHERSELSDVGVDLAIRMGRGNWHGFIADKLLNEAMVPVCAPAILERVRELKDIEQSPLIHVTTVSEDWAAWALGCGRPAPDLAKGLHFDTIQMAFEAASQGLGVAIGRKPLVNSELEAGSLVEVWETVNSNTSYWLIGAESRADDPRIIAFRSWILDEVKVDLA